MPSWAADWPPLSYCVDGADWHAGIRSLADGLAPVHDASDAGLRAWIAARLGPELLETHRWSYTAGSGACLDSLHGAARAAGRRIGVVLPTYQRVAAALTTAELATSIAVSRRDWDSAALPIPPTTDVLYLTPLHANPLARSLGPQALARLAREATARGVVLVEDDACRFLGPDDDDRPPLARLAPAVCLYLGSFTKMLGWPVKLGYAGSPVDASPAPAWPAADPAEQRRVEAVLRSGVVDEVVTRRQRRFADRQAELAAVLARHGVEVVPATGGLHLVALTHEHPAVPDALAAAGLGGLTEESFYGPAAAPEPFVRLGVSACKDSRWPALLEAVDAVVGAAADRSAPDPGADER